MPGPGAVLVALSSSRVAQWLEGPGAGADRSLRSGGFGLLYVVP